MTLVWRFVWTSSYCRVLLPREIAIDYRLRTLRSIVNCYLSGLEVSCLLPYAEDLNAAKIHVQAPTQIVMLCGGVCSNINSSEPRSLRDAFLKILVNPAIQTSQLIKPEDWNIASILCPRENPKIGWRVDPYMSGVPGMRSFRVLTWTEYIFDEFYGDLLEFETHLAQLTELILLFCESEGSLAELGAFSVVPEIADRPHHPSV